MTHRSLCCMPLVTLLTGLLVLSVGFNYLYNQKINRLHNIVNRITSPVDDVELKKLMEEVKRLSNQKYTNNDSNIQYDIKTKEPISHDF